MLVRDIRSGLVYESSRWEKSGDHPKDYERDILDPFTGAVAISAALRKANGFEGDVVRLYRHPDGGECQMQCDCGHTMHFHGFIDTDKAAFFEGETVCPGSWIVNSTEHDYQAIDDRQFRAYFRPVGFIQRVVWWWKRQFRARPAPRRTFC